MANNGWSRVIEKAEFDWVDFNEEFEDEDDNTGGRWETETRARISSEADPDTAGSSPPTNDMVLF